MNTQRIDLTWTDNSDNETGFVILRGVSGSSFAEIATVAAGVTTFYDTTAAGGKTYYYRVVARNSLGDSAPSNTSSALAVLKRVAGLSPQIVNWSIIDLQWADPNPYETGYVIETYDFASEEWTPLTTTPANAQTYRVTGRSAGTDYQFRIKAIGERESLYRNSAVVTTPAWGHGDLPAAEALNIESINGNSVRLTWTDNASDESGYQLRYRVVNGDGTFGAWTSITIPANADESGSFDLGGLDSETEYEVELIPLDPSGATTGGVPSQSGNFTTGVQAGGIGVFDLRYPDLMPPYISMDWTPKVTESESVVYNQTSGLHDETVTIIFTGLKTHRYIDLGLLLNVGENSYVRPEGASHGELTVKVDGTEVPMEGSFADPGWNRPYFYESWSPVVGENVIAHTGSSLTLTITGSNYSRASHAWWIQSFWIGTIMPSVSVSGGSVVTEGDEQKLQYTVTRHMYGAEKFPLDAEISWLANGSVADGDDVTVPDSGLHFDGIPVGSSGSNSKLIEIAVADDDQIEAATEIMKTRPVTTTQAVAIGDPAQAAINDDDFEIKGIEVSYSSQSIRKDDGSGSYSGLHWKDLDNDSEDDRGVVRPGAGEGEYGEPFASRVSRESDGEGLYESATVSFYVLGNPVAQDLKGIGMGTVGFEDEIVSVSGVQADGQRTITMGAEADTNVPWVIRKMEYAPDWKLTKKRSGGEIAYEGTSLNTFYVTGADTNNNFETVLDLGCTGADGLVPALAEAEISVIVASYKAIADSIFGSKFAGAHTQRVDGIPMTYWGDDSGIDNPLSPDFFSTAGLLKNLDGRCNAWALLLVDVLSAQGVIGATTTAIVPNWNVIGPVPRDIGLEAQNPLAFQSAMTVKEIPAQNNSNPWRHFSDHAVVTIAGIFTIYDPSYGILKSGDNKTEAENAWCTASLESFRLVYSLLGFGHAIAHPATDSVLFTDFNQVEFSW